MAGKKPWDKRRSALQQVLRGMREEAGLNQVELAKALNKDQSFISRYERGERRLDLIELADICKGCGVGLAVLISRYEAYLKKTSSGAKSKT